MLNRLWERSCPASLRDGALRLGEPQGRLLVPPVQPQGAPEIVDSLFVSTDGKQDPAADQMEPDGMSLAGPDEPGKGKPAAPIRDEA